MKSGKQSAEFLKPLLPHAASIWAVREPAQHLAMPLDQIVAASGGVARVGGTIEQALRAVPKDGPPSRVLICGSLYLAGEVLKADGG
jgi:dihydrofolate synthase/folylpolyglutamate synthase